jgi:hypothetical protein
MEGGLARVGILNTLKKPKHKKKKSKTPSPKRGTNISKAKQVGINALTTHTGAEKPSRKTTPEVAPNPKPRQGEGKPVLVKETQEDRSGKKQQKKQSTEDDPPEDPSSSSDSSGSDTSSSGGSAESDSRRRTKKPKREEYLTKYLQAKQRHFGGGDNTRIREYLAKETEFKGKKLRDLDVGPVIDFVREVLDYKSGMTPFTELVQKLMTLEVKDAVIASIGSTHKWALYDRADNH